MMTGIQVVAFDADDTLWVNEPYFLETENKFCALLEDYLPHHAVAKELFAMEMKNLALYGYGVKGFMLSMMETALDITGNRPHPELLKQIIKYGKELLQKPIELLEGVTEVLEALTGKYKLVVATKGDLLDQERKLKKSGIAHYFHHIEIMSDKQESDYRKLLQHLDIPANAFLMIGNSIKSDVLPVLAIGAEAVHVPYHTTWEHEKVTNIIHEPAIKQLEHINEILRYLPV